MSEQHPRAASRRRFLTLAGGSIVGVTFLGACGGGESGGEKGDAPAVTPEVEQAVRSAIDGGKVSVGKAAFLEDAGVVVTQPSAGEYTVFSDVCPHQNGRVTLQDTASGRLVCVLHGSQFDPATGEVVVGPAARGLTRVPVDAASSGPSS